MMNDERGMMNGKEKADALIHHSSFCIHHLASILAIMR